MDPQLVRFYRQYMQQIVNLTIPSGALLIQPDIQDCLFRYFFDASRNKYLPPPRFQLKILKRVVEEIEKSFKQPEDDQISDELMERFTELISTPQPTEVEDTLQKSIVTYFAPTNFDTGQNQPILISETKNILGSGHNVGLRTWEASLRLACYLMQRPALICDQNVLELGAGTGFLSIFCAGLLSARHVLASDGLAPILDSLQDNVKLNTHLFRDHHQQEPVPHLLDWREPSDLDSLLEQSASSPTAPVKYDIVLGADITYAPDLLHPLANLLSEIARRNPGVTILISVTKRNAETFELFTAICTAEFRFIVTEMPFECPDVRDQKGFFHSLAMPIRILSLTRDAE